jgi:hypothetical protein
MAGAADGYGSATFRNLGDAFDRTGDADARR